MKKTSKIILVIIFTLLVVASMAVLSGCAHKHKLTLVSAKDATCTVNGNVAYYICGDCGKWFSDSDGADEITQKDSVIISRTGHDLTSVPSKDVSCIVDGSRAYYSCNNCDKWFWDSDGADEITQKNSIIILCTGHDITYVSPQDASCIAEGNTAYYACNNCDKWFSDGYGRNEITDKSDVLFPKIAHKTILVPAKVESCTADGYTEHYACEKCDKWFMDSDGTHEITDKNSAIIPKLPHELTHVPAETPTCVAYGNIEYYFCSRCSNKFYDNDGKNQIADTKDYLIEKLEHQYENFECISCNAPQPETSGLAYETNGTVSYVVGIGSATDTNIVIASNYAGKPVSNIKTNAFKGCSNIQSVKIPGSVIGISNSAFEGCTSLTRIVIPNSVYYIGSKAFYGCTGLTNINIPDSVQAIEEGVFYGCSQLNSITIGNNVKEIDSEAFYGCSNLNVLVIPSNVTKIGYYAFYGCSNLTSFTIPDSVTDLGFGAFFDCAGLNNITIGSGVTLLGSSMFNGCSSLTTISIPINITQIDDYAFRNCTGIDSVYYTGDLAGWLSIDYSSGGESNPLYYAQNFYINNQPVTELVIPDNITKIKPSAFDHFKGLTSLTIGDHVTSIGTSAFNQCTNLTSVILGNGVTEVGSLAFGGCDSVQCYEYDNALYWGNDVNPYVLLYKAKDQSISTCEINANTRFISGDAFFNCKQLTDITIPNGVKGIGDSAFWGCTALTNITIPGSVTDLDFGAFFCCDGLISVTIGSNVKNIGGYVFNNCSSLTEIYFEGTVEQWKSVNKAENWNCGVSATKVTCKDGTADL